MRKRIHLIILLLLSILTLFIAIPTKADSGWDSDYDSGGSGSSSWDSDYGNSSWDNDYDSSSSGSSSGSSSSSSLSPVGALMMLGMIFGTWIYIYILFRKNSINLNHSSASNYYSDCSSQYVKKFGFDKEMLIQELFNKFIAIQNAWMNFDYDTLSKLCTNELFNTYKSQLNVLKIKHGKNIMHDFKLEEVKVTDIKNEGEYIKVTVFMKISFYDYVINTSTCKVTRGKKHVPITNCYEMTFIKGNKVIDKCPSCGATISGNVTDKCHYCRSVIVKDSMDFVLSKKSNVNGRRS